MIDFDAIRAQHPIADVVGRFIDLRRAGSEYVGLCPFHADRSPSFYVNPRKAKAFCMSCHWQGDVIDFVAGVDSVDLAEAARRLGHDELPVDRPPPAPLPPDTSSEWAPILPVPDDAPAYDPARTYNPKRGRAVRYTPSATWPYRAPGGQLLGYVIRFEIDGKKLTPQITYCQHADGRRAWCARPFPTPRPLFGLDKLAARPQAPVVVVEGEKAATAAQDALPGMVVVTWPGGTGGIRHVDFTPLDGRDLVLWPDADEPGLEAMRAIAVRVRSTRTRWIDTAGLPRGHDAADVPAGEMVEFCRARVRASEPTPPEPEPERGGLVGDEGIDTGEGSATGREPDQAAEAEHTAPSRNAATTQYAATSCPAAPAIAGQLEQARLRADLDKTVDPADNMPALYSEVNVARRFAQVHVDDLRFVAEWGKWMLWDGQRWRRDRDLRAFDLSTRLCCAVAEYARTDPTEFTTERQRQATIARYGEKRTIVNVVEIAKADRKIAAVPEQWDADLWLLNTPAGVVDLRDGSIQPQRRDAYQTRITDASPGGACPTWLAFLDQATAGDAELQAFLKRVAGYCLTGDVREHALFFVYGTGGNGKGTFINTLTRILGDYAQTAAAEMFTERKHDAHPTELAGLQGARLVAAQETEEGKRWAEARIKALTGGDKIRARYMRQDEFEFMPQFKLLIAGNHKPGLRNVDEAIKRRLHLIPFEVTPPVKDKALPEKLAAEADGILAWAIEGCLEWQRQGLAPPARVLAATADYLEQQDVLAAWIDECTEQVYQARRGDLYRSFKTWAEEAGEYVLPQKRWIAAMESRGYQVKMVGGIAYYSGITIKEGQDEPRRGRWS